MLTVAETEAMASRRSFPAGPERVIGIVTWNWPPKACAAALWYHRDDTGPRSELNVVLVKLKPEAGLNVTLSEPKLRVVE